MARDARWVQLSPRAAFLIAPLGRRYHAERARLALEDGLVWDEANPQTAQRIRQVTARAVAETILLDWRGIRYRDQLDPPYTPEIGYAILSQAPHVVTAVLRAAESDLPNTEGLARKAVETLRWQLRWGAGIDALRLSYQKTGTVPKALAEQPDLSPDVRFYLDAFYQLSRFRGGNGFGANPLAYNEISQYADSCGFERHSGAHDAFVDVLAALDSAYLEFMRQKQDSHGHTGRSKIQVSSGYRARTG